MEWYFHEELKRDADFEELNASLGNIARSGDLNGIAHLIELVAASAVTCELKGMFVGRIMRMNPVSQVQMKGVIEGGMKRVSVYNDNNDDGDELGMNFDTPQNSNHDSDDDDDDGALFEANHLTDPGTVDREDLETALLETRRELQQQKSQINEIREDSDKAQAKLRALVEDLQDRLAKRQDELITAEEELRNSTSDLDEAKNKVHDLEEEKAQLDDELDVASAKATQLHKAEATVLAYKKKFESVGMMNQQMTDLEDQAAGYLRQIMDLESEVKKTATLTRQVDSLQRQLASLEKERSESSDSKKNSSAEIGELKSLYSAAEKAKKMYQDELKELREQQDAHVDVPEVEGFEDRQAETPVLSAADREKTMRLEIENKQLKEHIAAMSQNGEAAPAAPPAAAPLEPSEDSVALAAEVAELKNTLAKREAENKKIGSDKDKLEAYTKRTLAKFQDKYLVALQECKAKLKEKQDKIEILESRSATEKTAQKREERLLSSTIYELGLAIMQNRLKER
jgi:protein HOOK3